MADSAPLWIYAILPGTSAVPAGVTGVAGEPVAALPLAGLAAAVGRVPAELASERALRQRLGEPAWLEAAVRRHHRVVAALFATVPTVPFRIATVYHDEQRARQVLGGQAPALRGALERVTSRAEWGVRAFRVAAPPTATGPTTTGPTTTGPTADDRAATRGPAGSGGTVTTPAERCPPGTGTTYLMRRQAALADRERARAAAAAEAERLSAALAEVSVAEHRSPVPAQPGPDEPGPTLLNTSFLVETGRADSFVATARELAAQLPHLRLRLAGPLPPYSFVDAICPS